MANTGIKSIAEGRSDIFHVDPRKLKIKEGWNSRDFNDPANVEHVDMLAQSIAAVGVKEPITIYFEDGTPYVSNGECRLRAVFKLLENDSGAIKTIPVRTEDRYANEADRLLNQYIRNTGKQFSQIELSNHFKRLLGLGWQSKDISQKAGISQARVSQILGLQTLPEGVKQMVVKNEVSASLAVQTVKEQGTVAEQNLKKALETAKADGKTKIKPEHLTIGTEASTKVNVRSTLKDVFEYADIDDSEDMVVIKLPADKFEIMRQLLEL